MSGINESTADDRVVGVFGDEPETLIEHETESNSESISLNDDAESEITLPAVDAQQEEVFNFDALPSVAQKRFKELEDFEHKYKSDEGRVAPLQRKIDDLTSQLQALQEQGKGESKAAQELEEAIEQKEIDLGGLLEELPELAGLVSKFDKKIEELTKRVNESNGVIQEKVIAPSVAAAQEAAEEKEVTALRTAHPDLTEIVSNPKFNEWVSKQHPSIAALMQSDSAVDVSAALTLYKDANNITPSSDSNSKSEETDTSLDDMMVLPTSGASASPDALSAGTFEHYAKIADEGKLDKISLR